MGRHPTPWYRRDRDAWYATVDGRRYLLAKGKTSRAAARAALARILGGAVPPPREVGITVAELFNRFIAHAHERVERDELTARSRDEYRWFLAGFLAEVGSMPATDLRNHHVQAWSDAHPTWGPTMRSKAITLVKALFRWGKRFGHLTANPIADMPRPTPKRREAIPDEAQVRAVIASSPDREWRDLVTALAETGCRPGELITLTARQVDLQHATWTVVNKTRHATGAGTRTIYLTDRMVTLCRELCTRWPDGPIFRNVRGGRWTLHAIACRFARRRAGAVRGMNGVAIGHEMTAYALRHKFITDALERGVPIATLAELVGHKDTTMIMRVYSKLSGRGSHLRAAVATARPADPDTPRSAPPPHPGPPRESGEPPE